MGNRTNSAGRLIGLAATILVATDSWGATWSQINTGLPSTTVDVSALVIAPSTPATIYARTSSADYSGGIFKTTDGGGSWRAISSVAAVNFENFLVVDPTNSSTIYALADRGILKSTNGGASWIGAGVGLRDPADGYSYVSALAIDPITPATLYACVTGVTGRDATIFKSTNGGGSWSVLSTGLPYIVSLVIDPTAPSTIYAAFLRGVLKTTDGGESWIGISAGLGVPDNYSSVKTLAIDPITPATLYVVKSSFVTSGIFKSTDGGGSWNALDTGLPLSTSTSYNSLRFLVIDPTTPSTIYASGSFAQLRGPASRFLIKSTDGGASWNAIDLGLSANTAVEALAIDPVSSSTIYAIVDHRILKSTDGGANWSGASSTGLTAIDVHALTMNPVDAATIYAGAGDSVFKSVDSGESWSKLFAFQLFNSLPFFPEGAPAYPHSVLINFVNANILYAGTTRGRGNCGPDKLLFKSTDGGVSWSDSISPGKSGCSEIDGDTYFVLKAMDPVDPNTLYVTAAEGLLRSKDGGASWINVWDHGVWALAIDPVNPATLYAGLYGGVFKSTDDGATWDRIGLSGATVNLLAIDPAHPTVLYAAVAGNFYGVPLGFQGLFKSLDSGASWSAVNNGLASVLDTRSNMSAILIDPDNSNIVYAGTAGGGVFKSSDGGASWSQFNDGLANLDVRVLAVAAGSRHTIYAGTAGGVFRITDDAP